MKILVQRGSDNFLVEYKNKYFMVDTNLKVISDVFNPNCIYRAGYCEEPYPTPKQYEIIEAILENK